MRTYSTGALLAGALAALQAVTACGMCGHAAGTVEMVRNVRRMQPEAEGYNGVGPKAPLEWGEINFLHTTDTHGWLEGHIKQPLYSADWGDWLGFVSKMRKKADKLGVDLLLIDTGDLHDGAGLSDATAALPGGVNGQISDPIFAKVPYDVLTIGNHELYLANIANQTFTKFAKTYGDRYVTSNVQIRNASGGLEFIGKPYRRFKTKHGLNVVAFGVLFDFAGNVNTTVVTKASDMVVQPWFQSALSSSSPVDLFLVIGHNPIRGSSSTFKVVLDAIRSKHPSTPIQVFGGHTHIRDFISYDSSSTGIESGQYCETFGWLAINGVKTDRKPRTIHGVPVASRYALNGTAVPSNATTAANSTTSPPRYSRRYLDWNRVTMSYHAKGFDTAKGKGVTKQIAAERKKLNLTRQFGCAPQSYCLSCAEATSNQSIVPLMKTALTRVVVSEERQNQSRMILINSGSIRYDLVEGPFTYDDSFIVSPFNNTFLYLPDVPFSSASQVEGVLNAGPHIKRSYNDDSLSFLTSPNVFLERSVCPLDLSTPSTSLASRSISLSAPLSIQRRQKVVLPGYVTLDDFGYGGDDIPHSPIPHINPPNVVVANGAFPQTGNPETVDFVFVNFATNSVLAALKMAGATYTADQAKQYVDPTKITSNTYLPLYAGLEWKNGTC